jgi:hypothetical protein
VPEQRTNLTQARDRRAGRRIESPAEAARRELIEWCEARRLPVPAERRPQSSGR